MELTPEQGELLAAIGELQGSDKHVRPSTKAIGARLLEEYKERGGPYFWHASSRGTARRQWQESSKK